MSILHKVTLHLKNQNRTISLQVPHGDNILQYFESKGQKVPSLCRNGCCTTCAVKIISGELDQSLGIGLSKQLIKKGYGLLCIAKAISDLEVETQDEDEVYEKQFGTYIGKLKENAGNPFEI